MATTYLLNAFSLQMVDAPCVALFDEVDELPEGLTSAIRHQDTANVLGVPMNRINVHLSEGDTAYVAQLKGGRLPEGSTTLPEGFSFKFLKVKVVSKETLKHALCEAYDCGSIDSNNAFYVPDSTAESVMVEYFELATCGYTSTLILAKKYFRRKCLNVMSTNDKGHSVVQSQGDSHKVTLRLNF